MKEPERYARLKYYKDYKGTGKEGFTIELMTEGDTDWGLDVFAPLVRREGAKEGEEADFVHFSTLKELAILSDRGYQIYIARD